MSLTTPEERLAVLETQYQQAVQRIAVLESRIPNSSIISPKFLSRAFTVWGHMIVAQLIVTIPIYCIIFGLGLLMGSSNGY
jgi:hypothetical protein